jgi:hypothetical protein
MAAKIKLSKARVKEVLKRVDDDPTLTPDEKKLIREVFEDAIRLGLVKITR